MIYCELFKTPPRRAGTSTASVNGIDEMIQLKKLPLKIDQLRWAPLK